MEPSFKCLNSLAMEMDNFEVEVKIEGVLYEGTVLQIREGDAMVEFKNGYWPKAVYPLEEVYYPPSIGPENSVLKNKSAAELFIDCNSKGKGWVSGIITDLNLGKSSALFNYQIDGKHAEIEVRMSKLRPANLGISLQKVPLYYVNIDIPDHLLNFVHVDNWYDGLVDILGKPLLFYNDASNQISMVTTNMFAEYTTEFIKAESVNILTRVKQNRDENIKTFKNRDVIFSNGSLIGIARGTSFSQYQKALRVLGVNMIKILDYEKSFLVFAQEIQPLEEAVKILEFSEKYLMIPDEWRTEIIGEDDSKLEKIISKTNVEKCYFPPEQDYDEMGIEPKADHSAMVISGNIRDVIKARDYIDFHLFNLRENVSIANNIEELRKKVESLLPDQEELDASTDEANTSTDELDSSDSDSGISKEESSSDSDGSLTVSSDAEDSDGWVTDSGDSF